MHLPSPKRGASKNREDQIQGSDTSPTNFCRALLRKVCCRCIVSFPLYFIRLCDTFEPWCFCGRNVAPLLPRRHKDDKVHEGKFFFHSLSFMPSPFDTCILFREYVFQNLRGNILTHFAKAPWLQEQRRRMYFQVPNILYEIPAT